MVRFEETPLSASVNRRDLIRIIRAGIAGASATVLMARALVDPAVSGLLRGRPVTVVAAGKLAAPMATALLERWHGDLRRGVVAATVGECQDERLEFFLVGHPVPNTHSVDAARRVLDVARAVETEGLLLVLLSGGGSAALAAPVAGLALADKVGATRALLRGGVAIDGVNCVRKHLSAIKGGWLAASTAGTVLTLAVSDVVGPIPDDPAVIGSGPTVADPTSFDQALRVADRPLVRRHFPAAARTVLERGREGRLPETPKPGDALLKRAQVRVIGSRLDAVWAAVREASSLGYHVGVIDSPVVGDARRVATSHLAEVAEVARDLKRPACVVSAGETTVEVVGPGRGGRNQEFALAAADRLSGMGEDVILASVGTDGVDGPTDAAGALVDGSTTRRARTMGIGTPRPYLEANDSYTFFNRLDDLVITGPTETNVGDLQVVLLPGRRC